MNTIIVTLNQNGTAETASMLCVETTGSSLAAILRGGKTHVTFWNKLSEDVRHILEDAPYRLGEDECTFILNGKIIVDSAFKGTAFVPHVEFYNRGVKYAWRELPDARVWELGRLPEKTQEMMRRHSRTFLPGIGAPSYGSWRTVGVYLNVD